MVALAAFSQTLGGFTHSEIAFPTRCVVILRDSIMSRLFFSLYLQFTDLPARLITASAFSNSSVQVPDFNPSQATKRQLVGKSTGEFLEIAMISACSYACANS